MKKPNQIMRVDGQNCFFEVLNDCFEIQMLQINFIKYDKVTKKQTDYIPIYLSFKKALAFCEMITNGQLDLIINNAKETGKHKGKDINPYTPYFEYTGGVNLQEGVGKLKFEKNKTIYTWLEKGKSLSRQFHVLDSSKSKYVFKCMAGHGNIKGNLIMPEGMPKVNCLIPVSEKDALAFALQVKYHINAYINQYYVNFSTEMFPNQMYQSMKGEKNELS